MRLHLQFPEISLDYLKTLTDSNGIIQHAKFDEPDYAHGYCADDNARALIISCMSLALNPAPPTLDLLRIYLGFLEYVQNEDGSFCNFVDKDMRRLDAIGSEDSNGRCIWASGYLSSFPYLSPNLNNRGRDIFLKALHRAEDFKAPRAKSYAIGGIACHLKRYPDDLDSRMMLERLALDLVEYYDMACGDDWHWFEDRLTYCNGKMVQALYVAFLATRRWRFFEVAEKTMQFLGKVMVRNDKLYVVGNAGWYFRDSECALYDQQPVDAAVMVELYATAFMATGRYVYYRAALTAFRWFLGDNSIGLSVLDPLTRGCYDGLTEDGINLNRGAESTVTYLLSRMIIEVLMKPQQYRKELMMHL